MRHAILSDVHANLPALRAVLDDARAHGAARTVCLGDLVGYHGFVHETLALLRDAGIECVAGNHDLMAIGRLPTTSCGPLARRAIEWTQRELTAGERAFLETLPSMARIDDRTILVHALPWSSETRMRLGAAFVEAAQGCQPLTPGGGVCFTGHTHVAGAAQVGADRSVAVHGSWRAARVISGPGFWFVNPGSVGHPRDGRSSASYLLFDDQTRRVRFRRVHYDQETVRARDAACGLAGLPRPINRVALAWRAVRAMTWRHAHPQ